MVLGSRRYWCDGNQSEPQSSSEGEVQGLLVDANICVAECGSEPIFPGRNLLMVQAMRCWNRLLGKMV